MKSPQFLSITLVCVMPILVSSGIAQDGGDPDSSSRALLSRLQPDSWATITPDHGSFRLRLLTNDEKSDAAEVVAEYRKSRASSPDRDGGRAYRALPSDVRGGVFYRASAFGSDAIALRGDQFHAILPLRSVSVVLVGPSGNISAHPTSIASRPSPQDFMDALRSGSRGSFGGLTERARDTASGIQRRGGLMGRSRDSGSPQEKASATPTVYFLKFAKADELAEIIAAMFANSDAQVAVDVRLNAIVVSCESGSSEQIADLIKVLDRETADEEKKPDGPLTLMTHDIGDADGRTVFQVLQTLLAGMPDIRISVDERNNRIIAQGRAQDHEAIRLTIEKLQPTRQPRGR